MLDHNIGSQKDKESDEGAYFPFVRGLHPI